MKIRIIIIFLVAFGSLVFTVKSNLQTTSQTEKRTDIPEVIVLGEKATLGKVTFNHLNHATKSAENVPQLKCVVCHHVEQPLSEASKNPLLKTVYPADRTVTLTAETLKNTATPKVTGCRSCHLQKGATPTILKEVPQVTQGDKTTVLTNQNAFHIRCAGCHDQVVKENPALKAPKTTQCTSCHKKA